MDVEPAVCVSLAAAARDDLYQRLATCDQADLVEVRFDALRPRARRADLDKVLEVSPVPVVVTLRAGFEGGVFTGTEAQRVRFLSQALESSAAYVDVEVEAPAFPRLCARDPERVIASKHWDSAQPVGLDDVLAAAAGSAPAALKLVTAVENAADSIAILEAGRRVREAGMRSACFAMGEQGAASRLLEVLDGGWLIYASDGAGPSTAPGQPQLPWLREHLASRRWRRTRRRYGVIGAPLEHSLSPRVFNAAFETNGDDAVYVPLTAPAFDQAMALADWAQFAGLSVTMPFKGEAASLAGERDAVNTLARSGAGWRGSNTDGAAVVACLQAVIPVRGARVSILGAGGAARGAAAALLEAGARVTLLGRDPERTAAAASMTGSAAGAIADFATVPRDVVVNATPVGMHSATAGTPIPTVEIKSDDVVVDMIYRPRQTELLIAGRTRGCRVIDGLEIFLEQAARQFQVWFGRPAPMDTMRAAAESALRSEEHTA